MVIADGKVFIDDGTVTSIDFKSCVVTLGKSARLYDCTFDALSEIKTEGADDE